MAARFCNWLQNGKRTDQANFESGVYDTSTFGKDSHNYFTDQSDPSPGAKYWLPSWDEWVKAAYYDPNKNGEGNPGYWKFPTSLESAPIQGLPQDGGQTNADAAHWDVPSGFLDVGSYASVRSPWGLTDASGSLSEWTGSWESVEVHFTREYMGSILFSSDWIDKDRIDGYGDTFPVVSGFAFRLAAVIPLPGTVVLASVVGAACAARRRPLFKKG